MRLPTITPAQRFVQSGARKTQEKDHFYPTPPEGTRALLAVEKFDGMIWECACGSGDMSRILEEQYPVVSTDLVDRGYGQSGVDFLMEYVPLAPNIVTNPPFKLAEEFARQALRLTSRKVALLCRIQFLEGLSRRDLFTESPLARVWIFPWRLAISRDEVKPENERTGSMATYAWFVWDKSHSGPPTLGWLP